MKLGDKVLVKFRNNTTIRDLLEQPGRASKVAGSTRQGLQGGRIHDVEGSDVTTY